MCSHCVQALCDFLYGLSGTDWAKPYGDHAGDCTKNHAVSERKCTAPLFSHMQKSDFLIMLLIWTTWTGCSKHCLLNEEVKRTMNCFKYIPMI